MKLYIKQFKYKHEPQSWCFNMWYVYRINEKGITEFMRNDGAFFPTMQKSVLHLNGGTYHPSERDANSAVRRLNAAKNQDGTSYTKTITNETLHTEEQEKE